MESKNQDDDSFSESKNDVPDELSTNVDFRCEAEAEAEENQQAKNLGNVVEQLKSIAESGIVDIDWPALKQGLKNRLEEVLDLYQEKNPDCKEDQEPNVGKFNLDNSRDEILELIASFNEAPFTIQRICELLYSPFKYYDKTSTFLRGLEKNLRVISSHDWPKSPDNDLVVQVDIVNNTSQIAAEQSSQQHEDMNQCEDQQQPAQALEQQPIPQPETKVEPSSSASMSSSSPPPPIKELT